MASIRYLSDNRYALHEVLGEGGTAVVHKAHDRTMNRWVAVKVLIPTLAKNKSLHRRFEREAKLMLRFDHRNVVQVFELGSHREIAYIVMELIEGGSLLHWIAAHGAMPPRMAVDAVIQVCAGIDHAHSHGVVHRDIKPQNVLVSPDDVCKVADFGIARLTEGITSLTRTGVMMGSSGFMAPEQEADAKNVGPPADVFSLGATLFALLTGTMPRNFRQAFDDLADTLPDPLAHVVMRATLDDPGKRYESVAVLSRTLYRTLEDLPDTPPRTPGLHTEPERLRDEGLTAPTAMYGFVAPSTRE